MNKKAKIIRGIIIILALVALIIISATFFFTSKSIYDLLTQNKKLKQALANLTQERQIGYAKVIAQEDRDGKLFTRLKFVETHPHNEAEKILEKEYEVEGDVVYFDALIVKFANQLVMDGKERSLYLWRRVYGETMSPQSGFPIETANQEPVRYQDIFAKLPIKDRAMFWTAIWELSNNPDKLREAGVTAIFGNAVYKKLRPGLIYVFKISSTGGVYPETVPDL